MSNNASDDSEDDLENMGHMGHLAGLDYMGGSASLRFKVGSLAGLQKSIRSANKPAQNLFGDASVIRRRNLKPSTLKRNTLPVEQVTRHKSVNLEPSNEEQRVEITRTTNMDANRRKRTEQGTRIIKERLVQRQLSARSLRQIPRNPRKSESELSIHAPQVIERAQNRASRLSSIGARFPPPNANRNSSRNLSMASGDTEAQLRMRQESTGHMSGLHRFDASGGFTGSINPRRIAAQSHFMRSVGVNNQSFTNNWENVISSFEQASSALQDRQNLLRSSRAYRRHEQSVKFANGITPMEERRRGRAIDQSVRGLTDDVLDGKKDIPPSKGFKIPTPWGLVDMIFSAFFSAIERIPFDVKIVIIIFLLSGIFSYLFFYFTNDYSRDVLALE